ncbi:NADH-dependent flavin oxidoreductase [Furfurilactobacillus cerevisiae]|uniref:NADH-dependent flavin oxidoreductase n=1 Tax=Furfurilactobacillus rossiae TaxID=231049 RepID=UPI003B982736
MKYQFEQPYTFANGVTIKNRVVMAPTTTTSSYYDGHVTNEEIDYYKMRAGGVGMVVAEVANVVPGGKGFEGELSIADDSDIDGLAEMARAIKRNGTKAVLQIFHAGRKSNSQILRGTQTVSASAVKPNRPEDAETPRALSETEIESIIQAFADATHRAIEAGFDGVELHGANTYLLQQFYSPHSNRREDRWGGNRDKRMNFARAVIQSVHEVISQETNGKFLLGYRISPEEIGELGIRLDDTMAFVEMLSETPIDYVHTSMGSAWRTSLNDATDKEPILDKIVRQLDGRKPLISVGSIETPDDAEKVLAAGASFAAIGREMIREPQWYEKVAGDDEDSIRYQISPFEMDELGIPVAMQHYLKGAFYSVMHFSNDHTPVVDYTNSVAPMEGFEKKM